MTLFEVAAQDLRRLDLGDPRWLSFVSSAEGALFFHHPAWAGLVADCYGYRAMAVATVAPSGALEAGVPLVEVRNRFGAPRWIALPFTDLCPALGSTEPRSLISAIVSAAAEAGVRDVEVRGSRGASISEETSIPRIAGVRHMLDLSGGFRTVSSRFSPMHQRNVRKAIRAKVSVVVGRSRMEMATFYRLHTQTRRRLGVPVQPGRFFDLLWERVIAPGHGFVLTAMFDGEAVAAAVFLGWNGVLIYKYGASDERFWAQRPNNLLFANAIEWGCTNGYHTFDFGRSDLEDEGLRAFKAGWGAIEEPLVYWRTGPASRSRGRAVAERAVGALIRRSHPALSRAIGELLYRYAA